MAMMASSSTSALAQCSYSSSNASTLGERLTDVDWTSNTIYGIYACTPFKWEYAVNLLCVVLWLIAFRWLYDHYMRLRRRDFSPAFRLADQLTTRDNPALAIDFASFLFAMCLITRGSLADLEPGTGNNARYFSSFFLYQTIGCLIIVVSCVLNDKCMVRSKDNIHAMVEERSVAMACVQAGTTIATAIIFAAAAAGAEDSIGEGLLLTILYWAIGQALLISYVNVVDVVTQLPVVSAMTSMTAPVVSTSTGADGEQTRTLEGWRATSLFAEAAENNVAAGVSVGFDLVHAGLLIAAPINVGYGVIPWLIFVAGSLMVVSPILHLYFDSIVLRGVAYSVNILRHQNWGAAVLVGSLKLLLALLLSATYQQNCSPSTLNTDQCSVDAASSYMERLGEVSVPDVFTWQTLTNLMVLLLLVLLAKLLYFIRFALKIKTFSLDAKLADPQNNAVAVSLAAFTFALGLTVVGVVVCPSDKPGAHAFDVILWSFIGCCLLLFAFAINDCVLLIKISNTEALLANNVAIACFEAGSFVACGVLLRALLVGGSYGYAEGLALMCVYWAVGQVLLLCIAYAYRQVTFFDDWQALKDNNIAAGLSGGILLVGLSVIMAFPIPMYSSLLVFLPIALCGLIALMVLRKLVDLFVLPGEPLDKEIAHDKNWGAALIEGGVCLGIAFISNRYVPTPGAPFVSESVDYWDVCG